MTDPLRMQHSDDEEEDLERLRLDALKTIPNKTEITPYDHPSTRPSYKVLQSQTSTLIHNQNNTYYHPLPQSNRNLPIPATRPLPNHFNNYDVRQNFERMDVNEPYVPQNILNPRINDESLIITKNWNTTESTIQVGSNYIPYTPSYKNTKSMIGVSNVQLSPRSMAFVAENNDILMRRKCEKPNYESNYTSSVGASPNYSPHSPGNRSSPNYRSFNERWSRSPTPKSKSRSPVFRHRQHSSYVNRRTSPKMSLVRSPVSRRKTLSKSPSRVVHRSSSPSPRQGYKSKSPVKTFKRERSRSPLRYKSPRRTSHSPNQFERRGRSTSKSPLPDTTTGRRSPQPYVRQHNYRSKGNSRSPDGFRGPNLKETNNKYYPRKSRSPPPPQSSNVNQPTNNHRKSPFRFNNRSQSRSPPNRRYHQKFSRKDYNNMKFNRRNSPFDYNNSTKRRNDNNNGEGNNMKNRGRKRSHSPAFSNNRKRYSKANTPEKSRMDDNRSRRFDRSRRDRQEDNGTRKDRQGGRNRNFERKNQADERNSTDRKVERKHSKEKEIRKNDKMINKTEKDNKTENSGHDSSNANKLTERNELNKASDKEKQQQQLQEEKIEKRDKNDDDRDKNDKDEDDSSNEDDDSNDDGIDLFASDESESENEGRFKLNSNKNGRDTQVSTVSFTKLSKASTPVVKDLQEITTSNVTGRDRSSKNDRDRDRERDRDRGRGRDHRDHDRDLSKSKRESDFDFQRRGDERFNKKSLDKGRSRRSRSNNNERRQNNKTNKNDNENNQNRRDTPEKPKIEKKSEDKPTFKSTFTVVENKELDVKPSSETGSPGGSPKLSSISRLVGGSSLLSSGKKPVHLRLGAMTNTFKASKKPSNWTSSTASSTSTSEKVLLFSYFKKLHICFLKYIV